MTDLEAAVASAIKTNHLTKGNTIHLKCLSHFSQMIGKHLRKYELFKKN